jgi:hypothetical protein
MAVASIVVLKRIDNTCTRDFCVYLHPISGFNDLFTPVLSGRAAKMRPARRRTHVPAREGAPIDDQFAPSICLACGDLLSPALERAGSLRCHDCRDAGAPLRTDLVEPPRELRPKRRLKLRPAA